MRVFARCVLLFGLLMTIPLQASEVVIVADGKSSAYREFAAQLSKRLQQINWQSRVVNDPAALQGSATDLIVTTGSSDLQQTLAQGGSTPVLAALISQQDYERIANPGNRPRNSAVFLDQPVRRLARFTRLLLPQATKIGVLQAPKASLANLRNALQASNLGLETELVGDDGALVPALSSLLQRSDALLATPDPSIYNRENIKPILITTYRYLRPTIAFSPALVKAGALAALYSTPEQIANQIADLINVYGTSLPTPSAPKDFAISVNYTVAESLGLKITDENTLRRTLLKGAEHD